jgi:hypothetical protein
MAIFKACSFSTQNDARCRNEDHKCSVHGNGDKSWKRAPQPTTVLLKINVNAGWENAFRNAGVPVEVRSIERAHELEQERVAAAAALGRSAYAIRDSSGRASGVPEDVDTGCPVFGKTGLADLSVSLLGVSLPGLGAELAAAGFVLTRASLLKRLHKPPTRLVLEFSMAGTNRAERFPYRLFVQFIETSFNQVDVWANERRSDGSVVHTVNCGKRDDKAVPEYRLTFANGDWDAIPLAPAVEQTA